MSLLGFVFGGGGLLMWFLEKRKYNETIAGMKIANEERILDNEKKQIDIDDKVIDRYKVALDDLGTRYEDKFKDVTDVYERKIKLLEEEINLRERIILSLKRENRDLKSRIKLLENENKSTPKSDLI